MILKLKAIGLALLYCCLFKLSFGLGAFLEDLYATKYYWFVLGTAGSFFVFLITWIFLKFEKSSFNKIGLSWESKTLNRFFRGVFIGVGIAVLMFSVMLLFADLKVELAAPFDLPAFLFWSLPFILTSFMEEVAFRSYPFLKLNKAMGLRFSQVFLAILFALYHVGEGDLINVLIGPGIWALVYGMAAVYSKGIAVPTGLHFGVNFVLASFGDKKGVNPIFIIDYIKEPTPEMLAFTNQMGVGIQIVMLIVVVVLMELYLKKKNNRTPALNI